MYVITVPMSAYRELILSKATELLADTFVQINRDGEIHTDDEGAEALFKALGRAMLSVAKSPPGSGEAHCA